MGKESRSREPLLSRLEARATRFLWSLLERDASTPGFWIKTTLGMLLVTAGPAILIGLFFLGRDLGYFE